MTGAVNVPVVLAGFGPVGRAYAAELAVRGDELAAVYGVRPRLVAVRGAADGCRVRPGGPVPSRAEWAPAEGFGELLSDTRPLVFAQAVPSSPDVAAVAAAEARLALGRGVHVVTATKGHLLADWSGLREAARTGGAELRFSGAVGAALPAGDVARHALPGFGCRAIRACPNGTSTYVLDRMAGGASLDDALADARARGIAEADPAADLSGADAATKVRLLTGIAWGWDVSAVSVRLAGIGPDTAAAARAAAAGGRRLRAVATAHADRPGEVTVELRATGPGDPLHAVTGPGKAVVFDCGDAGEITVSGGRSSPRGAALALLKDTLAVAGARRPYGVFQSRLLCWTPSSPQHPL